MKAFFEKAKPIWLKGKVKEKNCTMAMVCRFPRYGEKMLFKIAASSIYRVYLNGTFLGHGPARAAHGFFRVDSIHIPSPLLQEENILAVEIVNFGINSFYVLEQDAFVQAEIVCGNCVLSWTGVSGTFTAGVLEDRRRRVQRYSFQRPFLEAMNLKEGYDRWRTEGFETGTEIEEVEEKLLLERNVPWPQFPVTYQKAVSARGEFEWGIGERPIWQDRALFEIGKELHGFSVEELECRVSVMMDGCETKQLHQVSEEPKKEELVYPGSFYIADMGKNTTGFIGISLECREKTHAVITFDEVLLKCDVQYNRMACVNALDLELEAGSYCIETIQPYTCRYIKPMVMQGAMAVKKLYIRELKNPLSDRAQFVCDDAALNRIFEAGRETFAQNAVDLYMDCPSRERAGWLCDSFFTGRVEMDLTGTHLVEDNFLENYALPKGFECIPEGMVPMCYPSEHFDGNYIANWALWLILELYEYQFRNPGSVLLQKLKKRVEGILLFMAAYEGKEGLLENVPGWVFVEWSKANEVTAGVNFPSNMLYSAALLAGAELYNMPSWHKKGIELRQKIIALSYDGTWFHDQALRKDGKLVRQDCITEVCQYYAFFFHVADADNCPELLGCLLDEFGPNRVKAGNYPQVWPANAFIGNYLRMELLSAEGKIAQLLEESKEYFDYMAVRTGTLWENTGDYASCNHGFASHIIHCFYRDILGVSQIRDNRICLKLQKLPISKCEGKIPTKDGMLEIAWERTDSEVRLTTRIPDTFEMEVFCDSELELKHEKQ